MTELTQDILKKLLHYNAGNGCFYWIKSKRMAGSLNPKGYININIKRKIYKAHRLAFLYMTGDWPKGEIDHINHIRHDNRWLNLRDVPKAINQRNSSMQKNNKSGVTGVSWCKSRNKWLSQLSVNNKVICLGFFADKFEAICARKSANNKHEFHVNHGS